MKEEWRRPFTDDSRSLHWRTNQSGVCADGSCYCARRLSSPSAATVERTGRGGVPAYFPTLFRSVVNSDGERRRFRYPSAKGFSLKRRSSVFFMLDSSKAAKRTDASLHLPHVCQGHVSEVGPNTWLGVWSPAPLMTSHKPDARSRVGWILSWELSDGIETGIRFD